MVNPTIICVNRELLLPWRAFKLIHASASVLRKNIEEREREWKEPLRGS